MAKKDDHAWKAAKNQKTPTKSIFFVFENLNFEFFQEVNGPGSTMAARKAEKRRAKVFFIQLPLV